MSAKKNDVGGDRSFTLVEILNIASRDYPDDCLRQYYDAKTGRFNDAGSGDTLAEFIVLEIRDTFDATVPRRDQLAEVGRVLHRAITHLQGVIDAFTEAAAAATAPKVSTADVQEPVENSEQVPGPCTTLAPPRSTETINIPPPIWEAIIPVLSTAHIKETTISEVVDSNLTRVGDYHEGAFIHLGKSAETDLARWPELMPVIKWLRGKYPVEVWVRFDRDGDVVPGLPTFSW